ncbi:palmitoyltransferase, putative [Plasmodium chabaudi chabaudi]|uniref:Palmitoyltransferase, putative n=1 Tax=Plasmodium chabaudi chabaudi TaxID=31271 RepID=A0A1C6YE66_PLACU|nr:palmitoyltransferase, putative [Plasmodium chabaudi chabaudi]
MGNTFLFGVITFRLVVLVTYIYLKNNYNILSDINTYFLFYSISFLLYLISSLCNPGYITTCPTRYVAEDIADEFKKNIKNIYNRKNTEKAESFYNFSTSDEDKSTISSTTSSASSLNLSKKDIYEELTSLTILHNLPNDIVLTEKCIKKKEKYKKLNNLASCTHNNYDKEQIGTSPIKKKYNKKYINSKLNNIYFKLFLKQKKKLSLYATNIKKRKKNTHKYKPVFINNVNQINNTQINIFNQVAQKTTNFTKTETNKCYDSTLYKINSSNIIFSKNIKHENNNTLANPFHIYRDAFYQYKTKLNYCIQCDIVQILRSKHCKFCRRCIKTYDHHCPWINNCVGENNRSIFFLYLYFENITIFLTLRNVTKVAYSLIPRSRYIFLFWLVVLAFILAIFLIIIFFLAFYHTYLCIINETTWENLRRDILAGSEKNEKEKYNNTFFFISYTKNIFIYFFYLPIRFFIPTKIKKQLLLLTFHKIGVNLGIDGEIIWRPRKSKRTKPSSHYFFPILHCGSMEQLKWKQTKILYPLTILSKFSTWTDIQLTPNQQTSLMELANKTPKEKCDNNKIALKVTKIQNMSKQLKTAWEELDIYKQLLTENMELTLKKNEEPKQINTINFNEYSEVKEINYNLENISDSIVKEILDIYTNFVNLDHHLDSNEVRLEIVPGVGGQEAKMFSNELFSMYENFCKLKNYDCVIKNNKLNEEGKGISKNIIAHIKGEGVYVDFIQEIGIHRVQRIPINSKKMQTSTSIVLLFDEKQTKEKLEKKMKIPKNDFIIETKRSGGAGGQSVNKNETCVKITHKPTNIFVEVQKTSSQIQNKSIAMDMIKNKLYNFYYEQEKMNFLKDKKNQKQNGDRSEKIRTYNFSHNTVIDHIANVQYTGIDQFFKGTQLINLINKRKQLFYQNIIDDTLEYLFSYVC